MVAKQFPTSQKKTKRAIEVAKYGKNSIGQSKSEVAQIARKGYQGNVANKIAPKTEKPATKTGSYAGAIKRKLAQPVEKKPAVGTQHVPGDYKAAVNTAMKKKQKPARSGSGSTSAEYYKDYKG